MVVGVVGLGKMGKAISSRLISSNIKVLGFDTAEDLNISFKNQLFTRVFNIKELVSGSDFIWIMVPAGKAVDDFINSALLYFSKGQVVIDGGNSFFEDSIRRAENLKKRSIDFLDCGVSGGLHGQDCGFCLMVGGSEEAYLKSKRVFDAVSWSFCLEKDFENKIEKAGAAYKCGSCDKYIHDRHFLDKTNFQEKAKQEKAGIYNKISDHSLVGPSGAGHYVKMIHNGIEYALLQSYAEGFHLLKEGRFENLDLEKIGRLWNRGSIIRSWILNLITEIYEKDQDFKAVSGFVAETGMGGWMRREAQGLGIPVPMLNQALEKREESRKNGGDYSTKLVAVLRSAFGGHPVKSSKKRDKAKTNR